MLHVCFFQLIKELEISLRQSQERVKHIEQEYLNEVSVAETKSKAVLEQCAKLEQELSKAAKEKSVHEKKSLQVGFFSGCNSPKDSFQFTIT